MASPKAFFDSNIMLYTDDPHSPSHQQLALDLIGRYFTEKTGAISTQVLLEYFANATRKLKVDTLLAWQKTDIFSKFEVFEPKVDDILAADILAAIDLHRLHQISFWDAMIVRAAIQSGYRTLYSENMQHGRRIDNVEIVNPFL